MNLHVEYAFPSEETFKIHIALCKTFNVPALLPEKIQNLPAG
jgi:hypothetical protein